MYAASARHLPPPGLLSKGSAASAGHHLPQLHPPGSRVAGLALQQQPVSDSAREPVHDALPGTGWGDQMTCSKGDFYSRMCEGLPTSDTPRSACQQHPSQVWAPERPLPPRPDAPAAAGMQQWPVHQQNTSRTAWPRARTLTTNEEGSHLHRAGAPARQQPTFRLDSVQKPPIMSRVQLQPFEEHPASRRTDTGHLFAAVSHPYLSGSSQLAHTPSAAGTVAAPKTTQPGESLLAQQSFVPPSKGLPLDAGSEKVNPGE